MWTVARLAVLMSLLLTAAAHGSDETFFAGLGHLLVLRCYIAADELNVTWSWGGRSHLPPGAQVRNGMLWFLPVLSSHKGSYACQRSDEAQLTFHVSVSAGSCPDSPETVVMNRDISGGFPCKQDEVLRLDGATNIRWKKDCGSLRDGVWVNDGGFLRFPRTLQEDSGKYTCLVDVSVDGKTYTAARSTEVKVKEGISDQIYGELEVLYPHSTVEEVTVGAAAQLQCLVYAGFDDADVLTYWTIDSEHPEDFQGVAVSTEVMREENKVFHHLTLTITEVREQFLNVPIRCFASSPVEKKSGVLWLQEGNNSVFKATVAICLTPSLLALVLVTVFLLFRVDLLLAHRRLWKRLAKNRVPDGKLYDAYVSFSQPSASDASDKINFALRVLPEKLEKQHGYSLYIRGRDSCPGEAVHDAVATAMCQCRRLIIILSPETKRPTHGEDREQGFLCDDPDHHYEQKIGLFDALTQDDPKVVLVELGSVDYSRLPESLRYIKRKQGALKWRNPSLATCTLSKLWTNRNFWKNLIYQMPCVPLRRLRTAS